MSGNESQTTRSGKDIDHNILTHNENPLAHSEAMNKHNIDSTAHPGLQTDAQLILYPSAFITLYERTPPAKFVVRNGAVLTNASKNYPNLWEALTLPQNSWKCTTEANWHNIRNAWPWHGIGGVPYFVLNHGANTIRLPDTRGMYAEDAGFDGLSVGGTHSDMMRALTGEVFAPLGNMAHHNSGGGSGVFTPTETLRGSFSDWGHGAAGYYTIIRFGLESSIPIGTSIKPKAFGVLGCIYTG